MPDLPPVRAHITDVEAEQLPEAQAGAEGHAVKEVVAGIIVAGRDREQPNLFYLRHCLGGAESGEHGWADFQRALQIQPNIREARENLKRLESGAIVE